MILRIGLIMIARKPVPVRLPVDTLPITDNLNNWLWHRRRSQTIEEGRLVVGTNRTKRVVGRCSRRSKDIRHGSWWSEEV